VRQPASVAAAPARPKCPRCGSDISCKCNNGSGGGVIHPSLEAVDAGIEPTWRCS